jgi:hypothetical protein
MSLYRRILREAMKKDRLELEQWKAKESSNCTRNSNLTHSKTNHKSFLELRRHGNERYTATSVDPTSQLTTTAYAINEFRKQALSVNRSDFKKIDYMIRKGGKQIKLLRMPGVKLVSSTGAKISTNYSKA